MSEDDRRFLRSLSKELSNIFGIQSASITACDPSRFAVAPEIRCEDVPAETERGDQRQKHLPAPA